MAFGQPIKFIFVSISTTIGRFRAIAIGEGVSYLLFAITMPLKYIFDIREPNYILGMAHGILFITYIALCLHMIYIHRWNLKKSSIALLASIIPFGTFYADHKIFKKVANA